MIVVAFVPPAQIIVRTIQLIRLRLPAVTIGRRFDARPHFNPPNLGRPRGPFHCGMCGMWRREALPKSENRPQRSQSKTASQRSGDHLSGRRQIGHSTDPRSTGYVVLHGQPSDWHTVESAAHPALSQLLNTDRPEGPMF